MTTNSKPSAAQTADTYLAELKSRHKKPAWISTDDFFAALRGQEIHLTGYAGEFDPLFQKPALKKLLFGTSGSGREQLSPIGAFELSGHVFVAVVDPCDGYRSALDRILFVPTGALQTRLPTVPVRLDLGDSSKWDNPKRNAEDPCFFSFFSPEIDNPVLSFGTEYGDRYYPSARFYCNVAELQETVIPIVSRAELTRVALACGRTAAARPKKKI